MSDRFYKDIEIPDISSGTALQDPSPGFIQIYGKDGALTWHTSNGVIKTALDGNTIASTEQLGLIKIGNGLTIDIDGTLSIGNQIYFEEVYITVDQIISTLTPIGGYTVGSIEVFQNGILLIGGDGYTASDGISIQLADPIDSADKILIRKWYSSNTTIFGTTTITATANQTTFTVPNGYTPGSISVSLNGFLLYGSGDGYTATDGLTIVTTFPVDAGSKLCVHRWTVVNELPPFAEVTVVGTTENQTIITVPGGYTVGRIQVYVNGVMQYGGGDNYVAGDQSTITLATPIGPDYKLLIRRW